jgi:regulator of protease activity HflC (stomatin/prohibitin superfamily)
MVKAQLVEVFTSYGYMILQALVTDLSPDGRVRDAMNEINASQRMKEAAYQRAEGEKILKVKRAEAAAESMYLSGVGVARQRKAIMEGLRESILLFSTEITSTSASDIMDLLILNQYFDTLSVSKLKLSLGNICEYMRTILFIFTYIHLYV